MEPAASREDPVLSRLRAAAARGALSHALLFTGPGDRLAAARFASAAFQCTGRDRPCGVCPACRKVREGIHPDVSAVRDEEHKFLSVETIREVRRDAYIRPNEGARKVYLFPDCALLTEQDQNVLLKLVEEGPPYAAFLFCAENPAAVLQTLRSRCVELKLQPCGPSASPAGKRGGAGGPAGEKKAQPGGTERPFGAERGPAYPGAGPSLRRSGGGRGPGPGGGAGEAPDQNADHASDRAYENLPSRVRPQRGPRPCAGGPGR